MSMHVRGATDTEPGKWLQEFAKNPASAPAEAVSVNRSHVGIAAASVIAAAAFALAAVASTATATAGSVEDEFLANIGDAGIAFSSAAGAIEDAHLVCDYLADGRNGTDIGAEIMDNSDLDSDQAASFVVEAAFSYCPAHVDQVLA
jgi:hypothetical protein